jgi:histidine triad (HIT) family protein
MAQAGCIFCSIVSGQAKAQVVWQDDSCVAFLDARPLFPGHVLVVPRVHRGTLADLEAPLVQPLFLAVQRIAGALERGLGAEGSFVALNNKVSQSVPHLHAHVVPRKKGDGLRGFFWPRHKYASDVERDEIARRIAEAAT